MKQVKGSLILTIVKSIKVNHKQKREYDEILSDRAKEFLQRRILTGSWYPYEDFREVFDALCYVEARNNPKILVEWGTEESKRWLTTVYQSTIIKGDFQTLVKKYTRFHRMIFNFGDVLTELVSDTEIDFTYVDLPRDWANYYHTAVGWIISFIGLGINKKPTYTFLNKSWKGEGWTKVRLSWSP